MPKPNLRKTKTVNRDHVYFPPSRSRLEKAEKVGMSKYVERKILRGVRMCSHTTRKL